MPRNNMSDNWTPPAPAWQSVWWDQEEPLVAGYFGTQAAQPDRLDNWISQAFNGEDGPLALEQGHYVDQAGVNNYFYISYWRESAYRRWWSKQAAWWQDPERLQDGVGYWREIMLMPFDRFETLHSTENPHGIGVSADHTEGPIIEHGYPGSARDRIPLSDDDDLRNINNVNVPLKATSSDGDKRVLVIPPEHMCVIRSGQNWSLCDDDQKAYYLENLHPVLIEGMRFLRDEPEATHCYCMRFVQKNEAGWVDTEQTFGLGYATDIYAFENWAKSHPTHLAILGNFMKMVEKFSENMKLQLWHEVTVLPGEGCEFEYISCHSKTGLLAYT